MKSRSESNNCRQTPQLLAAEDGQAIAEFTLIAITFFFVLLGVIQLAMMLNAYSLVRYAAYNAARAAVVHGGDPQKMEQAARFSLLAVFPRHGRADHRRGFTENYLAAELTDSYGYLTHRGTPITQVQLLTSEFVGCDQIITFDDPKDSDNAQVTAQVVHQYEMVIPLVNRMVYWLWDKMDQGGSYEGENLNFISANVDRRRRSGDFRDIEYRIPLVAHYTMRLQSDYVTEACPTPTPNTNTASEN